MIKWKYKPSGWCPVQAEGWFLGYYFYFRARGKQATIDFSETEADWKDWKYIKEYVLYTTTYPKAGYLNKHFCLLLIYWGCLKFLLYLLYDKAKRKIM